MTNFKMSLRIITCFIKKNDYFQPNKRILSSMLRQYVSSTNKLQKEKVKIIQESSVSIQKVGDDKNSFHLKTRKIKNVNSKSNLHLKNQEHNEIKDDFYIYTNSLREIEPEDPLPQNTSLSLKPTKRVSKEVISLVNVIQPSSLDWHKQTMQPRLLIRNYMALSKIRLTGLVVLTTAAGYGIAYSPFDPFTFSFVLIGTGLMSAAANTINQFLEIPYDSQMARTKNRVLIRGLLTPLHAALFSVCTSTLGLSILYFGVNELTACLGFINLLLYTGFYTPMKRCSILNTWIGSIVGAIPPLMGWAACTGSINASGLLMGAILYSWQFPHFNALSWNLRPEYTKAGYCMMSAINPELCRKTALRHSIAIFIFCNIAPLFDLTTWSFPVDSFPFNCYFTYCAYKFYKHADSQSSRKLFRLSLLYLPTLMILMFVGRKQSTSNTIL